MKKFSYCPSEEEVKNMIKNIDTDKSGTIELSEFLAFAEK
jgi:Ca2+-binding EF-hand superfamily protein